MEDNHLYQDIAKRTDGDIYVGVVGPVRTGKSTFIKRFMDLLVIPNIDNEYKKERARDELPQSAGGRTIMTTEPKFIPNEAVGITVGDNIKLNVRLVDCVGYLVNNAIGYSDEEITVFYAGDLKYVEQHLDAGEVLDIIKMPFSEVLKQCLNGEITDVKTIVGAFWLQNYLSTQKEAER